MRLHSIKDDTKVLVLSNMAEETISILKENGICHFQLAPYVEGMDTGSYPVEISRCLKRYTANGRRL